MVAKTSVPCPLLKKKYDVGAPPLGSPFFTNLVVAALHRDSHTLDGDTTMPLNTVSLGAALTPTVFHTLVTHVGLAGKRER